MASAAVPGLGEASLASSEYMRTAKLIWFRWFKQTVRRALPFAPLTPASNKAARIATIAITINNSIRVNPLTNFGVVVMRVGQGGPYYVTSIDSIGVR